MTYKDKKLSGAQIIIVVILAVVVVFAIFSFSAWLLMLGFGGLASGGIGKAVGFWQAFPMAVFLTLILGGRSASKK